MTQHWHLDFFLITTCSTWLSAPVTGATTARWTSTAPGDEAPDDVLLPPDSCSVTFPLVRLPPPSAASVPLGDDGEDAFLDSGLAARSAPEISARWTSSLLFRTSEMGRPPFSSSTSSSASRLRSPSGRNGLSCPDSVLWKKRKKETHDVVVLWNILNEINVYGSKSSTWDTNKMLWSIERKKGEERKSKALVPSAYWRISLIKFGV